MWHFVKRQVGCQPPIGHSIARTALVAIAAKTVSSSSYPGKDDRAVINRAGVGADLDQLGEDCHDLPAIIFSSLRWHPP